jgi:hypothetical protein
MIQLNDKRLSKSLQHNQQGALMANTNPQFRYRCLVHGVIYYQAVIHVF